MAAGNGAERIGVAFAGSTGSARRQEGAMWAWHPVRRARHNDRAYSSRVSACRATAPEVDSMSRKTMFLDLRQVASAVYRVTTESSTYILGFHEEGGRKFVVVRGLPGTDREHLVIRDSDPRIGGASMFDLPTSAWIGETMEIGTMTTSAVTAVTAETDRAAIASVGGDAASARVGWPRPTTPS